MTTVDSQNIYKHKIVRAQPMVGWKRNKKKQQQQRMQENGEWVSEWASVDTETNRIDSQSSETYEAGAKAYTAEKNWTSEKKNWRTRTKKKEPAEPNLTLTNEKRTPNWAQNARLHKKNWFETIFLLCTLTFWRVVQIGRGSNSHSSRSSSKIGHIKRRSGRKDEVSILERATCNTLRKNRGCTARGSIMIFRLFVFPLFRQ